MPSHVSSGGPAPPRGSVVIAGDGDGVVAAMGPTRWSPIEAGVGKPPADVRPPSAVLAGRSRGAGCRGAATGGERTKWEE
mmetsp:Transcript_54195/g.155751  ORF Transcript_54195/g.155751 Transcript_54195/m.155751 type:complete len:80 (-) Transcript_54195:30-269(-)